MPMAMFVNQYSKLYLLLFENSAYKIVLNLKWLYSLVPQCYNCFKLLAVQSHLSVAKPAVLLNTLICSCHHTHFKMKRFVFLLMYICFKQQLKQMNGLHNASYATHTH